MKVYDFVATETVTKNVRIEANSLREAMQIADYMLESGQIDFDEFSGYDADVEFIHEEKDYGIGLHVRDALDILGRK